MRGIIAQTQLCYTHCYTLPPPTKNGSTLGVTIHLELWGIRAAWGLQCMYNVQFMQWTHSHLATFQFARCFFFLKFVAVLSKWTAPDWRFSVNIVRNYWVLKPSVCIISAIIMAWVTSNGKASNCTRRSQVLFNLPVLVMSRDHILIIMMQFSGRSRYS